MAARATPTTTANQRTDLHPAHRWLLNSFLPYQIRWIEDESDVALALKGRQLGWSDATAGRAIYRGFYKRKTQIILSASQALAEEVLEKVRAHCRLLALFGEPWAAKWSKSNTTKIEWATGGRVIAVPASIRTARSWTGDVYFDEFAYHDDPFGMWQAAAPIATRGGHQLRVFSTPNGAQGVFYEWCQKLKALRLGDRAAANTVAADAYDEAAQQLDSWGFHYVDIDTAVADGLEVDVAKLWSLVAGDVHAFNQAYKCSFLDGALQYIPTAWIERAQDWTLGPDLNGKSIRYYAGLDVGRHVDLSVLTVIAAVRGIAWVLLVAPIPRTKFELQAKAIADLYDVLPWDHLRVDATGLGVGLVERLQENPVFGSSIIPITFTNESKEAMATRAMRFFMTNAVRLPKPGPTDPEGTQLGREVQALERVISRAGNVSYEVPRGPQGHGDRFWSFALALLGAAEPPIPRGMGMSPVMPVG